MNKFMQAALKEAQLAQEQGEVPVGAAVFQDGKLIAAAHNLTEQTGDPTAHAELLAIKAALAKLGAKNLMGCELFVTLEPCAMCTGAIHLCKLNRVYFGAYDAKSGACGGSVDLPVSGCFDYKTEVYGSIDEPQCEAILKEFFKDIRKGGKHGAKL
ncbi:nucleoside deaminase [Congzhengia minquanensis]|uniref:tRNA-specific adenosine deaminase n=1 Tax=Congzhengia minquanensis TaxID=2763657 RepID=A0A926DLP5_9FIRM|nr:nucleoside deaminase [Congzhengia minquanensis]MBC8541268.1 nucleoside deaminase [Congzhengia minquanensis]